jgi:hypothetical protein
MKTSDQLLLDHFRFATFDAGRRLQMALGVEGEWEKRNNGYKDYSGQPETAHMHTTHDFIQVDRELSILILLL